MAGAIALDAARDIVVGVAGPLEAESLPLRDALGRVTAAPARARHDVQPFDNSAMDGFAIAAGGPEELRLVGDVRAGASADAAVGPGEALAISTGARLPAGADTVVRLEDARVDGEVVRLAVRPEPGANIRRAGEDMREGGEIVPRGRRLTANLIAALAAGGADPVECVRRPSLRVVATGDELVPPEMPLQPGQIHESNGHAVAALAIEAGGDPAPPRHAGDSLEAASEAVRWALEGTDIAVFCGGVSVGPHDHVKPALEAAGAEQLFWGLDLKPGKPTWFGRRDGTLVFGLPGNPVSTIVTFALLVRPAIEAMLGRDTRPPTVEATMTAGYERRAGRTEALRVTVSAGDEGWVATPTGAQGSHVLSSMVAANGLAIVPAETASIAAGERVSVVRI